MLGYFKNKKSGEPKNTSFSDLQRYSSHQVQRDFNEGTTVILRGQYSPVEGKDREFKLFRVKINCCGADAVTLKAKIVCEETIQGFSFEDWVRIEGELSFQRVAGTNDWVPVITLPARENIQRIEKPGSLFDDDVLKRPAARTAPERGRPTVRSCPFPWESLHMTAPSANRFAPRRAGVLGTLQVPLGLGLLRLGTEGRPAETDAVAVIHFALDQGIRLLDTADVYSLDQNDLHYGERLVRLALDSWNGPRAEVKVLTKAGLTRPKGRWLPDNRPAHLRKAVERSLTALGLERLFLLQLHARDSRVPFEETLGALAELQNAGKVEHLGLCNVAPIELRQALRHFRVAVVQNELSILQRKSASDGTVALTKELGIPFLAYRPLGGYKNVHKVVKSQILRRWPSAVKPRRTKSRWPRFWRPATTWCRWFARCASKAFVPR